MTAGLANSKLGFLDTLRRSPFLDSPIVTGLIMAPAVWFSLALANQTQHLFSIWVANAIVFMWLLPVAPRRLPWHILCAGVGYASASWYWHTPLPIALIATAGSMAKISLLLAFTRRYYDVPARRFRISALRFTLLTIAAVDLVCLAVSPLLFHYINTEPIVTMLNWSFGDVLGILLVTALVGFWRRRAFVLPFERSQLDGTIVCIAVTIIASWVVFGQSAYSIRFLIVCVLIYVAFKRGLAVSILCLTLHAVIASAYTLRGTGPMALLPHITPLAHLVSLQVYLILLLATIYPVGVVLYAQQKLQSLYSLLADNSGDVITRANLAGVRHYCSPSVTRVLGWTPAEMVNVTAANLYHPDDAPHFKELFQRMRAGETTTGSVTYRALTKSGHYMWMEAHIRVLVDPVTGDPTGFIANSRDISERVAAEAKLQAAHKALMRLASTDPLTGLANRRTFDESLEREWRRAQRERTPLALIMMDVDYFKRYNDTLGHPAGDEVMRRIALCLTQVIQRPSDMVARYGGEEFVALLPFTEAPGAEQLAQRIMEAMNAMALPHPASPGHSHVTLSIGVASIFPSLGYSPTSVVTAADRALYLAKNNGRNRIEIAQPQRDPAPQRANWEHIRLESIGLAPEAADFTDGVTGVTDLAPDDPDISDLLVSAGPVQLARSTDPAAPNAHDDATEDADLDVVPEPFPVTTLRRL
jgi:diguanylate cyclase (GGDEF)-like protein/PAS domain S-box-containing protein